ncbi:DEAD/DEAH box helicase [Clostridium polynesiense]|uniref:DEAD/DEAH box helicase n=1 Tax=Clostridium polynesiense TaxID=1325933 RepID=UPI00058E65BB|nr:DEAD/DEAH box helicase [Clostridium polynesiense]
MHLRDYQRECLDIIDDLDSGSYLAQLATGLGKTVTLANIKRKGRVLVLAHREELVKQPIKYYDCPVGIEMAKHKSNGEEVVVASVTTLVHRMENFKPDDFDMIITDECHHAAASSYRKIYDYFKPRLHIGFTATPNRGDNVRLDDIYQEIIFERDLKWAIKNKFLCDINCLRVNIGYDISKVARRMGDYAPGELEKAMNTESLNQAIAEAYRKHAKGQTLIFATSVQHCIDIAKEIPGAVAVTGDTKNREELIRKFTNREIPVLVNCMIFTEGTDMPLIETIMIARPTSNSSLYTQMVGRGLRLHPDKEKLTLIDLVGTTGKANLCTAPTLLGVDMQQVPQSKQDEIEGDLFDLPDLIVRKSDCVESWIKNVEIVNLWAKEQEYTTHNINFFKMPGGELVLQLKGKKIVIQAQDEVGQTVLWGQRMKMQQAIDEVYKYLLKNEMDQQYIWDLSVAKSWGKKPASDKQKTQVKRFLKNYDTTELTKLEASQILNRLFYRG